MKKKNVVPIIVRCPEGDSPDIKCRCGGDVWIDGEGHYDKPIGFGGHDDGKFYFDKLRFKGWVGQCEKCKRTVIAFKKVKKVSEELTNKR